MKVLKIGVKHKAILKNIWRMNFQFPFDPYLGFEITRVATPDNLDMRSLLKAMARRQHILFSALNPARKDIRHTIESFEKFPGGEFCSYSPKVAMQFLRGHRLSIRDGDKGYICILADPFAKPASSPSMVQSPAYVEGQQDSYFKTSATSRLLAVVTVTVRTPGVLDVTAKEQQEEGDKDKSKKKKKKKIADIGDEVTNDVERRRMMKIKRKRMDNFGIKEDY